MTGHVFISHSSQDREYADRLAAHLEDQNIAVWLDSVVAPGDSFEQVIRERIAECSAFVVILSPAALASVWVTGEVLQAIDTNKLIMPLILDRTELPVPLRTFQYENVLAGQMPTAQFISKLCGLVGVDEPGATGRHRVAGSRTVVPDTVAGQAPSFDPAAEAGDTHGVTPAPADSVAEAVPAVPDRGDGASQAKPARRGRTRPTRPPFTDVWPPVVTNATLRATVLGHDRPVYSVMISPDGRWLATAGDDALIRISDMGMWGHVGDACRVVLTGHTDRVTSVAFAPDSSWLATASDDGKVRIWDRESGTCHATLFTGRVQRLAIAADGTLITVSGAAVMTWELDARRVRSTLVAPSDGQRRTSITALAVAPNGQWLATGDEGGTLRIWDLTRDAVQDTITGPAHEITAMVISANGARLAAAYDDGTLRLWHQNTRSSGATFAGYNASKVPWSPPLNAFDYRFAAGRETVWAAAIAPDATWLATAESDRMTRIWETSTGDVRAVLRGRRGLGRKAATVTTAIAPDGTWLATGDSDGVVRVWDVSREADG